MGFSYKNFLILKVLFTVLNACLLIGGMTVMCIYLRILQYGYLEGAICTVTGVATILLCMYGSYNAYYEKKGMLIVYLIFMSAIVIAELVVAIRINKRKKNLYLVRNWDAWLGIKTSFNVLIFPVVLKVICILMDGLIMHCIKAKVTAQREVAETLKTAFF